MDSAVLSPAQSKSEDTSARALAVFPLWNCRAPGKIVAEGSQNRGQLPPLSRLLLNSGALLDIWMIRLLSRGISGNITTGDLSLMLGKIRISTRCHVHSDRNRVTVGRYRERSG